MEQTIAQALKTAPGVQGLNVEVLFVDTDEKEAHFNASDRSFHISFRHADKLKVVSDEPWARNFQAADTYSSWDKALEAVANAIQHHTHGAPASPHNGGCNSSHQHQQPRSQAAGDKGDGDKDEGNDGSGNEEEEQDEEDDFCFLEEPRGEGDTGGEASARADADVVDEAELDVSAFRMPPDYEPAAIRAIQQELQQVMRIRREERGYDAAPVGDSLCHWEVKLWQIPQDEPLFEDMCHMGLEAITLHILFPPTFPFAPPYIRVVRPRFAFRTGHVTVGGSLCIETLTNSGWLPSYRMSQIMMIIVSTMVSGGARLDRSNPADYSAEEAKIAFTRVLSSHGWTHWMV